MLDDCVVLVRCVHVFLVEHVKIPQSAVDHQNAPLNLLFGQYATLSILDHFSLFYINVQSNLKVFVSDLYIILFFLLLVFSVNPRNKLVWYFLYFLFHFVLIPFSHSDILVLINYYLCLLLHFFYFLIHYFYFLLHYFYFFYFLMIAAISIGLTLIIEDFRDIINLIVSLGLRHNSGI